MIPVGTLARLRLKTTRKDSFRRIVIHLSTRTRANAGPSQFMTNFYIRVLKHFSTVGLKGVYPRYLKKINTSRFYRYPFRNRGEKLLVLFSSLSSGNYVGFSACFFFRTLHGNVVQKAMDIVT